MSSTKCIRLCTEIRHSVGLLHSSTSIRCRFVSLSKSSTMFLFQLSLKWNIISVILETSWKMWKSLAFRRSPRIHSATGNAKFCSSSACQRWDLSLKPVGILPSLNSTDKINQEHLKMLSIFHTISRQLIQGIFWNLLFSKHQLICRNPQNIIPTNQRTLRCKLNPVMFADFHASLTHLKSSSGGFFVWAYLYGCVLKYFKNILVFNAATLKWTTIKHWPALLVIPTLTNHLEYFYAM